MEKISIVRKYENRKKEDSTDFVDWVGSAFLLSLTMFSHFELISIRKPPQDVIDKKDMDKILQLSEERVEPD